MTIKINYSHRGRRNGRQRCPIPRNTWRGNSRPRANQFAQIMTLEQRGCHGKFRALESSDPRIDPRPLCDEKRPPPPTQTAETDVSMMNRSSRSRCFGYRYYIHMQAAAPVFHIWYLKCIMERRIRDEWSWKCYWYFFFLFFLAQRSVAVIRAALWNSDAQKYRTSLIFHCNIYHSNISRGKRVWQGFNRRIMKTAIVTCSSKYITANILLENQLRPIYKCRRDRSRF